jgi:hypothetical protein
MINLWIIFPQLSFLVVNAIFLVATQHCECKNRKISPKKAGFRFEKICIV